MALLKPKKKTIADLIKDIRSLEQRRDKIKARLDAEQARQASALSDGNEPDLSKANNLHNEISNIDGMISQVTCQLEDVLIAQRQAEDESLPGLEQQFNASYSAHLEKCGRLVGEAISALQTIRQPGTQRLAADLLDVYRSTTKHSSKEIEPFSKGFVAAMNEPGAPTTVDTVALKERIRRIKRRNPLQGVYLQLWAHNRTQRLLSGDSSGLDLEVPIC